MNRITFCKATVKRFGQELQKVYQRGDHHAVRRIRVLLTTQHHQTNLAESPPPGIWLSAFLMTG